MQKSVDRGFAAISVLGQSRSEHVLRCFRIVPLLVKVPATAIIALRAIATAYAQRLGVWLG